MLGTDRKFFKEFSTKLLELKKLPPIFLKRGVNFCTNGLKEPKEPVVVKFDIGEITFCLILKIFPLPNWAINCEVPFSLYVNWKYKGEYMCIKKIRWIFFYRRDTWIPN